MRTVYDLTLAEKYRLAKLVERRDQIDREIADIYMRATCHYIIDDPVEIQLAKELANNRIIKFKDPVYGA